MSNVERLSSHALARVLGTRQDGTASVDSSRGLLMTVLGEFVLPNEGRAWTQTLLELSARLGVRDKAARQALARMHDRGWLSRERIGRQTRWMLTDDATELLVAGADRIYGFGREERAWDGTWVLLLASVADRDRRYRMGIELSWAGFGLLAPGVWICPWPEQETVAVDVLETLGVSASSFVARLGELGEGQALADQAWDLQRLRGQYDEFLHETAEPATPVAPGVGAAIELTALVHRWRRFPLLDPDLPRPLLPEDWPGSDAAARFSTTRAALLPAARDWWRTSEARYTPLTSTKR